MHLLHVADVHALGNLALPNASMERHMQQPVLISHHLTAERKYVYNVCTLCIICMGTF